MVFEVRCSLTIAAVLLAFASQGASGAEGAGESIRMSLLPAGASEEQVVAFFADEPSDLSPGYDTDREKAIRLACSGAAGAPEGFATLIFALVVEPAIDFLKKTISRRLEEEGQKYAGSYAATVAVPFYKPFGTDLETPTGLANAWTCFRFTRKVDGGIALDLIGQVRLVPDKDAMQVRALRLYYASKKIAKADNNEVGLAANIAVASVYLNGVMPKEETMFEHLLFSSKRTIPYADERRRRKQVERIARRGGAGEGSLSQFDYMGFSSGPNLITWDRYKALLLPRWSIDNKKAPIGPGMANITVTIVEAGRKPDILEFANWYYSETKDKWSKLLKEAAKKALDPFDT